MGNFSIDKVKVGHSALTNSIYIYGHGKDEYEALESRNTEGEVLATVIQWLQMKDPETGTVQVNFGEKKFELQVTSLESEEVQHG